MQQRMRSGRLTGEATWNNNHSTSVVSDQLERPQNHILLICVHGSLTVLHVVLVTMQDKRPNFEDASIQNRGTGRHVNAVEAVHGALLCSARKSGQI